MTRGYAWSAHPGGGKARLHVLPDINARKVDVMGLRVPTRSCVQLSLSVRSSTIVTDLRHVPMDVLKNPCPGCVRGIYRDLVKGEILWREAV